MMVKCSQEKKTFFSQDLPSHDQSPCCGTAPNDTGSCTDRGTPGSDHPATAPETGGSG